MVTQEFSNSLEKPYEDPNFMPMNLDDSRSSEALVQVEGAGAVPVRETADISSSLLTEVPGQRRSLPASEEGKNHAEQQPELPNAAREAAAAALQSTMETPDAP